MFSSILKLLYRPLEALEELKQAPPLGIAATLFIAVTAVVAFGTPLPDSSTEALAKISETFPVFKHPREFVFGFGILSEVLSALILHGAASLLGGKGSFKALFTNLLLIATLSSLPTAVIGSHLVVIWAIHLWKIILICLALHSIYQFSAGQSIGAYIVSFFGMMLLWGGAFGIFWTNGSMREKFLQKPALTRIQVPAHFDWTLKSLDGHVVPFESFRGKVVVLNQWATWCGPCRYEMPSLQRLYDQVKNQGIAVIGMSSEDTDRVKAFVQKKGYSFPVYTVSQVPPMFRSSSVPVTFILSPAGDVVATHTGAAQWDAPSVVSFLKSLSAERSAPSKPLPSVSGSLRKPAPITPAMRAEADKVYLQGKGLERDGKKSAACEAFEQAVAMDPKHARAHLMRGVCFSRQGRLEDALDAFKLALSLDMNKQNQAVTHHDIGLIYLEQGKKQLAAQEFKQAIADDPQFHEPVTALRRAQASNALVEWFWVSVERKRHWTFLVMLVSFVVLLPFALRKRRTPGGSFSP